MPNMRNSYMGNLGSYRPQRGTEDMAGEVQQGQARQAGLAEQSLRRQAQQKANTIGANMQRFPGRAPNGTGETGVLGPMGWALMQQDQQDYLKAQARAAGKEGPDVRVAPYAERVVSPYEDPAATSARSAIGTMSRGGTTPGYSNMNSAFAALAALYGR